mgnify:FL=1
MLEELPAYNALSDLAISLKDQDKRYWYNLVNRYVPSAANDLADFIDWYQDKVNGKPVPNYARYESWAQNLMYRAPFLRQSFVDTKEQVKHKQDVFNKINTDIKDESIDKFIEKNRYTKSYLNALKEVSNEIEKKNKENMEVYNEAKKSRPKLQEPEEVSVYKKHSHILTEEAKKLIYKKLKK